MTAQQAWKSEYRRFKKEMKNGWPITAIQIINNARRYVREAALERKLEAAHRRIAELEYSLDISRSTVEVYANRNNQSVISDHDARFLEQYHERM